jgi:hypothetical protein
MQANYIPFDGEPYQIEETEGAADLIDVMVALNETGTDWLDHVYTRTETIN